MVSTWHWQPGRLDRWLGINGPLLDETRPKCSCTQQVSSDRIEMQTGRDEMELDAVEIDGSSEQAVQLLNVADAVKAGQVPHRTLGSNRSDPPRHPG
jgi:hypothetical protein